MGRAEPARLIFAYKGVKYEDYRFKEGEFATVKPTLPFGQVPVLTVDGKVLSQSTAINRYLGRKFGLAGINEWESAHCDMLVDGVNDVLNQMGPWFREQDPEKKKSLWEDLVKNHIAPFLTRYDGFLAKNGSGVFVGSNITWADFVIFSVLGMWSGAHPEMLKPHENIKKFLSKIGGIESIKHWIETRPKTPM
jgi:glutathione S-transferase